MRAGRCVTADRANVRFGSLADVSERNRDVRFTPESGHAERQHRRPLSVICRHCKVNQRDARLSGVREPSIASAFLPYVRRTSEKSESLKANLRAPPAVALNSYGTLALLRYRGLHWDSLTDRQKCAGSYCGSEHCLVDVLMGFPALIRIFCIREPEIDNLVA